MVVPSCALWGEPRPAGPGSNSCCLALQERGGLLPRHHHHHHHRYDSANASDDNETTEGEQLLALTSSRKPRGDGAGDGVVSLQLAATGADTAYV